MGLAHTAEQTVGEVGADGFILGVVDEAVLFVGVAGEVVEILFDVGVGGGIGDGVFVGGIDGVFPFGGAEGTADLGLADLDEDFVGPIVGGAVEELLEGPALDEVGQLDAGGLEDGGGDVEGIDEGLDNFAVGESGAGDDQGDADAGIVAGAFVFVVASAEVAAVVAEVDEEGVVGKVQLVEG